jgi:hypothetical protein
VRAVNEFAAAGVQLSAVNIMTMNYGDGTTDMGTAAIAAAKATGAQLGSVPAYAFLTSAQRLSLVGVTPMVGLNDIPRDATKVGAFARANGLAGLGWWEMTRDQPCVSSTPAYMCSGVTSSRWSYANTFMAPVR